MLQFQYSTRLEKKENRIIFEKRNILYVIIKLLVHHFQIDLINSVFHEWI